GRSGANISIEYSSGTPRIWRAALRIRGLLQRISRPPFARWHDARSCLARSLRLAARLPRSISDPDRRLNINSPSTGKIPVATECGHPQVQVTPPTSIPWDSIYASLTQTKFAASFVLPRPSHRADCG